MNYFFIPDPGPMLGPDSNVETFIEDHKRRSDLDPCAPPFDDLRNYAYEGGGSTAGSLSSLGSGRFLCLKFKKRYLRFISLRKFVNAFLFRDR